MTNFDAIKSKNIDEMAKWINLNIDECVMCDSENCDNYIHCIDCYKSWLQAESE